MHMIMVLTFLQTINLYGKSISIPNKVLQNKYICL